MGFNSAFKGLKLPVFCKDTPHLLGYNPHPLMNYSNFSFIAQQSVFDIVMHYAVYKTRFFGTSSSTIKQCRCENLKSPFSIWRKKKKWPSSYNTYNSLVCEFQFSQNGQYILSSARRCATTAASYSLLLSVSSRVVLCGVAARALILLYRRFISFLQAGDYFSINNTGKAISM